VNGHGAKLLVTLIPTWFQVEQRAWNEKLAERPALASHRWDFEKPNRLMRNVLEANQIDYLDLLPALRSFVDTSERSIYLPIDGHWNADGHKVAAEQIGPWLSDIAAER
jgi:hypothetical protein